MNTILVPLDGSMLAEQVLPSVELLAQLLDARVHLLRIVPVEKPSRVVSSTTLVGYDAPSAHVAEHARESLEQALQHADSYLDAQVASLEHHGLTVTCEAHAGDAAAAICECAAEQHADLIAMMSHGYSGVRRWALGSVSDKVLHATHTPLFLARSNERIPTPHTPIKRILVPLDGSAFAQAALTSAIALARTADAEITLLHVVPPLVSTYTPETFTLSPQTEENLFSEADLSLHDCAEQVRRARVPVTTVVVYGYIAEAILAEAASRKIDLIVMATHGRSGMQRLMLGSVADKLAHASSVPLLLVRPSVDAPANHTSN